MIVSWLSDHCSSGSGSWAGVAPDLGMSPKSDKRLPWRDTNYNPHLCTLSDPLVADPLHIRNTYWKVLRLFRKLALTPSSVGQAPCSDSGSTCTCSMFSMILPSLSQYRVQYITVWLQYSTVQYSTVQYLSMLYQRMAAPLVGLVATPSSGNTV